MITAACRAGVNADHGVFQLPAVPDGDACTIDKYCSNSDAPVLGWASIHSLAA